MVDSKFFKSKMILFDDNLDTLADAINISRQSLSKKINNKIDFWQSEINIISKRYQLTPEELERMFFSNEH